MDPVTPTTLSAAKVHALLAASHHETLIVWAVIGALVFALLVASAVTDAT